MGKADEPSQHKNNNKTLFCTASFLLSLCLHFACQSIMADIIGINGTSLVLSCFAVNCLFEPSAPSTCSPASVSTFPIPRRVVNAANEFCLAEVSFAAVNY